MVDKPHIVHTATLGGHGSATSAASRVQGGWLRPQAQEAISKLRVHRAFDDARDPYIAKQLKDMDAANTERITQEGGSESGGNGWLKAQKEAAFKNSRPRQPQGHSPQQERSHPTPSL